MIIVDQHVVQHRRSPLQRWKIQDFPCSGRSGVRLSALIPLGAIRGLPPLVTCELPGAFQLHSPTRAAKYPSPGARGHTGPRSPGSRPLVPREWKREQCFSLPGPRGTSDENGANATASSDPGLDGEIRDVSTEGCHGLPR